MDQICPCCHSKKVTLFKSVGEYNYFNCSNCDSIFLDTKYLLKIDTGHSIVKYEHDYWEEELASAKERSYGVALARMAEAIYYCKRPIENFLDIGTGPGYFLDAVKNLLPDHVSIFYGVELFPPEIQYRTTSENYFTCDLEELKKKFDCGICMEVIEHLTPVMLSDVFKKLAAISNPEALYIFNTGLPEYVKKEDIDYLDPTRRGHLVSYSLKAIHLLAKQYGFVTHRIIGKTWAFALEFTTTNPEKDIRNRIWKAQKHNMDILTDSKMGSVLKILGSETVRAYN
jgi:hypothetical protein